MVGLAFAFEPFPDGFVSVVDKPEIDILLCFGGVVNMVKEVLVVAAGFVAERELCLNLGEESVHVFVYDQQCGEPLLAVNKVEYAVVVTAYYYWLEAIILHVGQRVDVIQQGGHLFLCPAVAALV